jgi:hypothetical protein
LDRQQDQLSNDSAILAADGSVRQPLNMGAALAEFVLDALEAAVEVIDPADHRLPLRRKPRNDERRPLEVEPSELRKQAACLPLQAG